MKNQQIDVNIVEIASKEASGHIGRAIFNLYSTPSTAEEVSVYAAVFKELLVACAITEEEMHQRIRTYAHAAAEGNAANTIAGNLIKESRHPNMGQKVFKKLIKAVFPVETWWRADLMK